LPAAVAQLSANLWATIHPICKATGLTSTRPLAIARAELFLAAAQEFSNLISADYSKALDGCNRLHALREDEETEGLEEKARAIIAAGMEAEAVAGEVEAEDEEAEQLAEVVATLRKLESFQQMNATLHNLDLFSAVTDTREFAQVIERTIEAKISECCDDEYEEPLLGRLLEWLDAVVLGWLRLQIPDSDPGKPNQISAWSALLEYGLHKALAQNRIAVLFDIIVEFPDSIGALEDLEACINRTDLRGVLVSSLKAALRKRLLLPGANTQDILTTYINSIKALRKLDPSGVMLDLVCAPVRAYLQGRDDTVRCIITSLIDDANSELSEELADGRPIDMADSDGSDVDSDDDFEGWMPDPLEADLATSRSRRTGDVTSMLITIYGSKELFVTEYQALLAERLLALPDYNMDAERKHLELLKLRFGEEQMQQCEVMLKDFADSKRVGTRIADAAAGRPPDSTPEITLDTVFILSRLFWPTSALRGEDTLEVPPAIKAAFKDYSDQFGAFKAARALDYKPHLGTVKVSLELESGTQIELEVSPILATIICHFEQQDQWTLKDLSAAMKVPTGVLEKRLGYWTGKGLIKHLGEGVYLLDEAGYDSMDEQHRSGGGGAGGGEMDGGHEDSQSDNAAAQREEEEETYWGYIQGMLQNSGAMDVDGISSMLGIFVEEGFSWTDQQLGQFLQTKVTEGIVTRSGGEYALVDEDP
jgi:anaphase-promoting complex subunit 2